jgi:PhnB protein
MASNVKPVPEGYHTVTPYLNLKDAHQALDFIKKAFGAEEKFRMPMPDGKIGHAEIRIGDSMIMLSEAMQKAPKQGSLFLYVSDVDAVFSRAKAAGATVLQEPQNMFWGDRYAIVEDAWGNSWSIATHIEDVPPGEMEKRAEAAMKQMQQQKK